jgi:hypothetical protein
LDSRRASVSAWKRPIHPVPISPKRSWSDMVTPN